MPKFNSPKNIVIIGGGFSGTMVATHLLHLADFPLNIKLIEPKIIGRGVAYTTDFYGHLLNVPAGKMSAFPDDTEHFLRWLYKQDNLSKNFNANSFVPRKIYGKYIQSILDETIANTPKYINFEWVKQEAIAIKPDVTNATVFLSNQETISADKIVLALGNFPPSDPPVIDNSFYNSQRYINYPWSKDVLNNLSPNEDILLIGSGLTMIDLALAIKEQNHTGIIHVVSRKGFLPYPHKFTSPYPAFLKPETAPTNIRVLFHQLRQEIATAAQKNYDFRAVIDSLRPITQTLWQNLPLSEKRRFLRHVRPYWEIYRHRVAPEVANTIDNMMRSEQIIIHSGRIKSYHESYHGVNIIINNKTNSNYTLLLVNKVINCTGPECNYRKFNHPLIVNLLKANLIRPDALGLGLDVAANGAILQGNGIISQVLYTLGPPRKGCLWETTAVPEIRCQALALAKELLQ